MTGLVDAVIIEEDLKMNKQNRTSFLGIDASPFTVSYILSNASLNSLNEESVLTSNMRGLMAIMILWSPERRSDVAASSRVFARSMKVVMSFSSKQNGLL